MTTPGMTIRDYFLAHAPALPDLWYVRPASTIPSREVLLREVVEWRTAYADAMLAAREEKS